MIMNISKQSKEFLGNLRLYLFSSGKNEEEIEGIIGELKDHLSVAEAKGKSVEDIIGGTPKEYMEQIAGEMSFDLKSWLKYIPILIIGLFAYDLLGNALRGGIEYSLLELGGNLFILLLFLSLTLVIFKYVASKKLSKTKEYLLFAFLGFSPISLFIGLIYLDRYYETPTLVFSDTGNIIAIIVAIVMFIGISFWSKTWISIIFPLILFLPEFIMNLTNLKEELKLTISGIVIPLCIGIYFFIAMKIEKNKGKKNGN
jgi:DNA-binding ferritin-like protein (Dps family)